MDRFSLVPVIVVIAVGLMVWYVAAPIVSHHFLDIWSNVKLSIYQWYLHDSSESPLKSIAPYILAEADDSDAQAQMTIQTGQRQDILYGNSVRNVTVTFYIPEDGSKHLEDVLYALLKYNVSKAVFFLEDAFAEKHPIMVEGLNRLGYTVRPWTNTSEYDRSYPPTTFNNIPLTDREILAHNDKIAYAVTFLENGIHYWNSSTIAFTPKDPPKFQYSNALMENVLKIRGTIQFTDSNKTDSSNVLDPEYPKKLSMNLTEPLNHTLSTTFDSVANPKTDLIVTNGSWTLSSLHARYPDAMILLQGKASNGNGGGEFMMNNTIILRDDAQLRIANERLLIRSDPQDVLPRRLEVIGGKISILNSTVTSWDSERNAPDRNAYHPRPYLTARNGGTIDVINSSITYLGFPLGGISNVDNARAAIQYRNTGNFTIANSTIAHNYYGFYTSQTENFTITNNKIYANDWYGLDPHTGSGNFVVDSNHIHDNGNQGFICSKYCFDVTVTNNLVEYNTEGIGLHWLTNSSTVQDNVARYNDKYGIYIDKQCYDNLIVNNTVIGNKNGIGVLDRSYNNTLLHNVIENNRLKPIVVDESSAAGGPPNSIENAMIS
ncbi:MAG TPA: right-handed parallel beta-helix repeat-containing protein [Nitrososphaera sp.]|jgi:parallel beta-helix repeat protein